jgi:hypothetical protein
LLIPFGMRTTLAVAVLALAVSACGRPSYGSGVRSIASGAKKLGSKVAAIAGKVEIKADAKAIVKHQIPRQLDQRVASIAPINLTKSVRKTAAPVEQRQPIDVQPTVIRHDGGGAATEQVYKNMFRAGEKASCEKVATFESCSATCSEHMRGETMRQLSPQAGKPMQCECTQGYSKCD